MLNLISVIKFIISHPFNKGQKYDGWIYEFNYKMLPKCLVG